jgi:hypothetical protein
VLRALALLRAQSPSTYARLRVHFIGTSNQREATDLRVLPRAAMLDVDDAVTEAPARIDYLDALNVQARAHAVLLVGSTEPHYTPSKVFPALLARRPIVALYHAASSVVEVMRHAGADGRLITFDE